MSNTIAYIIKAVDKFSPTFDKLNKKLKRSESRMSRFGNSMIGIGKRMSLMVSAPLLAIGTYAVKTSAEFDGLRLSMGAFLKAQKASVTGAQFFDRILKFAQLNPAFKMRQFAQASLMLLNVESYKKVIPTMKMLGDVAAGTGSSIKDVARIYSQVMSFGHIKARYANELMNRRIPILTVIAKKYKITYKQLIKYMEAGKVTSKLFAQALTELTKKGAKFHNFMALRGKILSGRVNALIDSFLHFADIFGGLITKTYHLKRVVRDLGEWLWKASDSLKSFSRSYPMITKIVLGFAGLLVILPPILILLGAIALAVQVIVSPITLVAFVITSAVVGMGMLVHWLLKFKIISDGVKKSWSVIKSYVKFIIDSFKEVGKVFGSVGKFLSSGISSKHEIFHRAPGQMLSPSKLMGQSAHVTVHIKDKGNNVSSVEGKHKNMPRFNIGLNMFGTSPQHGNAIFGGI